MMNEVLWGGGKNRSRARRAAADYEHLVPNADCPLLLLTIAYCLLPIAFFGLL